MPYEHQPKCRLQNLPCPDVNHSSYLVPSIDLHSGQVSILLISESAPASPSDYYYAAGDPLFQRTTVQALQHAGAKVSSIQDIFNLGVYLATAVKCGKTSYAIQPGTIKECSRILEQELLLFPYVRVFLLMGDVPSKPSTRSPAGRGSPPI